MTLKILVTGGIGLVGDAIYNERHIVKFDETVQWCFLASKECDLRNTNDVEELFATFKPEIVIHLAAKVGGLFANMSNNYNMLSDNIKININILDACKKYNIKRLINILSTCVFPAKDVTYPLSSDQILNGPPDKSNEGYAIAKRLLYSGSKLLSNCSNTLVINLTPTNLFGKNDNYNLLNGHVIPSLIHKCYISQRNNSNLFLPGTGKALRQFVYANDFAKIILQFIQLPLKQKITNIIVSPPIDNEISIQQLVTSITDELDFKRLIIFDNKSSDGQLLKSCDNSELNVYLPNFQFTPFNKALKETIHHFKINYQHIRK